MPCLYITTNLNLEGVNTDPIFADATKAVASIIGKPEHVDSTEKGTSDITKIKMPEQMLLFVMVILKGSVPISFNGNKEAAAYAEIVSMGGINKEVKRKLIATLGAILQDKLSIPKARFFLKVFDTTATAPRPISKM